MSDDCILATILRRICLSSILQIKTTASPTTLSAITARSLLEAFATRLEFRYCDDFFKVVELFHRPAAPSLSCSVEEMENVMPPAGGNQSKGQSIRAVVATLYALVLLSFILRMTTRVGLVGHFGWDDFIMILAMVGATASFALTIENVKRGLGRHTYYLTVDDLIAIYKMDFIVETILIVVICLTKVSICFFVLRIPTNKKFIWFLRFLIVSLFATNGATLIVLLASCRPVTSLFDFTVKGSCWNTNLILYTSYIQGGFAILTDLACTSLPIVVLWNSRIPLNKKLAIWALMALGLVSTGCCTVRAILTRELFDSTDNTWGVINVIIIVNLEQSTGLIAANIPVSISLYKFLRMKLLALRSSPLDIKSRSIRHQRHESIELPR